MTTPTSESATREAAAALDGVETPGQLAELTGLGCNFVQGFLTGRPVPLDRLREVIDGLDLAALDGADPTLPLADVH